jgi:hypothetical protein
VVDVGFSLQEFTDGFVVAPGDGVSNEEDSRETRDVGDYPARGGRDCAGFLSESRGGEEGGDERGT